MDLNAATARSQSQANKEAIYRRKFDDLWGQLVTQLDEAIERGDFQTEIETNASGKVLDDILAKLKHGKFDVTTTAVSGTLYNWNGFRPPAKFKLWIGWADDECAAAKQLPGKKKAAKKTSKVKTRAAKRSAATSAPTA